MSRETDNVIMNGTGFISSETYRGNPRGGVQGNIGFG
jgi:hypothetical protein